MTTTDIDTTNAPEVEVQCTVCLADMNDYPCFCPCPSHAGRVCEGCCEHRLCESCDDCQSQDYTCGCDCGHTYCADCCEHSHCESCGTCTEDQTCGCTADCHSLCSSCCRHTVCSNCGECSSVSRCDCDGDDDDYDSDRDDNDRNRVNYHRRPLTFWVPSTQRPPHILIEPGTTAPPYYPLGLTAAETVRFVAGHPVPALRYAKGYTRNKSRRFASLEIETSNYGNPSAVNTATAKWQCSVVQDGSIDGFEINTAPACGDVLIDQLTALSDALRQGGITTDRACGLHIHLDARDFGYQDIQRLVITYSVLEPVLYAIVHPSRATNDYCLPCGDTYVDRIINGVKPDTKSLKRAVVTTTYGEARDDRALQSAFHGSRSAHYGSGATRARYYALNLHSWFMRGTIECRMHHGTVKAGTMISWAQLWLSIMDWVLKTPLTRLNTEMARVKRSRSRTPFPAPRSREAAGYRLLTQMVSDDLITNIVARIERFYFNNRTA
jgi:hypothetical protein